jgi:hypothetical protein
MDKDKANDQEAARLSSTQKALPKNKSINDCYGHKIGFFLLSVSEVIFSLP